MGTWENITTEEAVTKLCEVLKKDPEYYNTWKANIAIQFIDEYNRRHPSLSTASELSLHNLASTAADNFLRLLISK